MSSSIRVFVHWNNPTVFSGEDLECKIIFKNVAPPPQSLSELAASSQPPKIIGPSQITTGSLKTSALPNPRLPRPRAHGHRPTVSLDVPIGGETVRGPGSWTGHPNGTRTSAQQHRRSISIISLGRGLSGEREGVYSRSPDQNTASRRPVRSHTRSASLQVLPRRPAGTDAGPPSGMQNTSAKRRKLR